MKKKQLTLVALFMAVLFALPVLFFINCRVILDNPDPNLVLEKREPAPLPSVQQTGVSGWPTAMEEYLRDHLPLRRSIIQLNASLDYNLFHSTTSRKIMIGKEGWLFFKDHESVTNIADYQGLIPLDEALVQQTAELLQTIGAQQAQAGRTVVLFIPPNKEAVYGEYLPDGIPQLDPVSRCDRLLAQLAGRTGPVHVVDPKPVLMQTAQQDKTLYYKLDTHWNIRGAYVGLQPLMELLQVDFAPYDPQDFAPGDLVGGDIAVMGALVVEPDQDYIRLWDPAIEVKNISDHTAVIYYNTHASADPRTVLVLGDSFRYSMEDVLPYHFNTVIFIDLSTATAATIEAYDPDIIVIEQLERTIDTMPQRLANLIA